MLMDEHLGRMAEAFPDETAFSVVDVGSMTFAEWDGEANAMARALVDAGLGPAPGSASTCAPSSPCAGSSRYSAAHRAGGVAVPMNPRLGPGGGGARARPFGSGRRGGRRGPGGGGHRGGRRTAWESSSTPARREPPRPGRPADHRPGTDGCSTGTTSPPATAAPSRSRAPPTTWPTSCTPRARPAGPRAWRSGTPTDR